MLERYRTQELLLRYLPPPPAVVLDHRQIEHAKPDLTDCFNRHWTPRRNRVMLPGRRNGRLFQASMLEQRVTVQNRSVLPKLPQRGADNDAVDQEQQKTIQLQPHAERSR